MVRLHRFAVAALMLVVVAVPSLAQARKPLSTATLAPAVAVRPNPLLHLELAPPATQAIGACRLCGAGIPDARFGKLLVGADSVHDRLRLYVKRDFTQWSVDVGMGSAVVGYGFRF